MKRPAPETPTVVVADASVRLAWTAVPGAEAYVVRRGGEVVGRVRETSFVEPLDKFSEKSRPTHPELLDALCAEFARNGTRLRPLMKTILLSRAYQASCATVKDVEGTTHLSFVQQVGGITVFAFEGRVRPFNKWLGVELAR